jgi:hypothetical protein
MFWDPALFWQPPGTHCLSVVTSDVFSLKLWQFLHVFPQKPFVHLYWIFFATAVQKFAQKTSTA